MSLPQTTIEGNLGADPELRFTPNGAAVANFRVACTERRKNEQTQQWEDGRSIWISVAAWRELAENVAESLHRGDSVLVTGFLYEEQYQTQQGENRTALKMDAKNIGVSLRNATARPQRAQRQGGNGQQNGGQGQAAPAPTYGAAPAPGYGGAPAPGYGQQAADPWAQPPAAPPAAPPAGGQAPGYGAPAGGQQGGWGAPPDSEPPF